jgi:hypothetical protein
MFGSRHVEFQIVIIVFCEDTNHGVKSFQVQFTAFGENYSLQWNTAWGQFRVTKAGVDCNYANLATLENTSFQVIQVAPEQTKPLPTPFVVQVD